MKNLRAAAALLAAVVLLPVAAMSESGAASSSASGFSWFANAPSQAALQSRANLRAHMVINSTKSWICTPAGFGKRSTCVAG